MPGGKHLNMQAWAPEEDQIILDMVAAEGPKWSRIVMRLPGRTVSSVRNRWQRIEKGRKLREAGIESKNRCHQCGEPKRGHVCFAKLRGGPQVIPQVGSIGRVEQPLVQIPARGMPPQVQPQMNQLPASTNGVPMPMLLAPPPPPRRTRSSERLVERSQTEADRLRQHLKLQNQAESFYGSSSLFPPAADAGAPLFTVDVAAADNTASVVAPGGAAPPMMRSDTSFFRGLAESESFSPCTRELFESWASSPREKAMPAAVAAAANDTAAPLPLQRFASGESAKVPKLTRSVSSYLANPHQLLPPPPQPQHSQQPQQPQQLQPQPQREGGSTNYAPLLFGDGAADVSSAILGLDARPPLESRPSLTRRRSSRLSTSFLLDML